MADRRKPAGKARKKEARREDRGSSLLPAPSTTLIGRRSDLEALEKLFGGTERLVTITGPAGLGKTRLALELARSASARRDLDGVWFCDLTEARDVDGLCAGVGLTLELGPSPERRGAEPVARVGRAIAERGRV